MNLSSEDAPERGVFLSQKDACHGVFRGSFSYAAFRPLNRSAFERIWRVS
jgi:hypothetical protein